MKLFLQKKCKIFERWGLRPQTPCLRRLGALPPNPKPPAAGGFAPRPPLASGGWGLRPQTPKTAPPLQISGYAPAIGQLIIAGHNFQRFSDRSFVSAFEPIFILKLN